MSIHKELCSYFIWTMSTFLTLPLKSIGNRCELDSKQRTELVQIQTMSNWFVQQVFSTTSTSLKAQECCHVIGWLVLSLIMSVGRREVETKTCLENKLELWCLKGFLSAAADVTFGWKKEDEESVRSLLRNQLPIRSHNSNLLHQISVGRSLAQTCQTWKNRKYFKN